MKKKLYLLYFGNRANEYSAYFFVFVVAVAYASVSHLVFGRPETRIVLESIALIVILLVGLPLVYPLAASTTQPFWLTRLTHRVRLARSRAKAKREFLRYRSGHSDLNVSWARLLMRDSKYERNEPDPTYALRRIHKIRELYRMLEAQKDEGKADSDQLLTPQTCIIELSDLIGHLGTELTLSSEYRRPTIDAAGLLAHIANEVRKTQGEPALENERSIQAWFTANPMNTEQTIEMLAAVVFGMAFRLREDNRKIEDRKKKIEDE